MSGHHRRHISRTAVTARLPVVKPKPRRWLPLKKETLLAALDPRGKPLPIPEGCLPVDILTNGDGSYTLIYEKENE